MDAEALLSRAGRRLAHIGPGIGRFLSRDLAVRRLVVGIDLLLPLLFFRGERPFLLPPIEIFGMMGLLCASALAPGKAKAATNTKPSSVRSRFSCAAYRPATLL